jgi:hypothetical protein
MEPTATMRPPLIPTASAFDPSGSIVRTAPLVMIMSAVAIDLFPCLLPLSVVNPAAYRLLRAARIASMARNVSRVSDGIT